MARSLEAHRPPLRSVLETHVTVTVATYTAKAGDRLIGVNRAGAVTVTLPTAQVRPGRCYTVKDESGAAATNNITVATEGSETIDGSAPDAISENYGATTYYADGSNWFTVPLLAVGAHTLDSHTGTLQHEKGGLEADISAGDGFVEVKGGSTIVIKSKTNGTIAPGVNDDSGAGYAVGSIWIDTTNNKAYLCLDASSGAAVWTETTQAGGGDVGSTIINFTRTAAAGSGSQALTGAGFQPTTVIFFGTSSGNDAQSWGATDDASGESCTYNPNTGAGDQDTGAIIKCGDTAAGNYMSAVLTSLDADGFTVSWTETGTMANDVDVTALCLR